MFLPDSFAQVGSPEYTVRVIYFLPNGRAPQPDINENLDKLMKDTQLFFADQMTAHGFSRKTFRFEADTTGNLVVHRLNGQFNDAYYHSDAWGKVWKEIEGRFDLSNNIWLVALDVSTELINNGWCGMGWGSALEGRALMPASGHYCFNVSTAAHELGHTFGLMHDNRVNGRWVVSVHTQTRPDRMITSFCSAEWMDVHRYFEINHSLSRDQRIAVETLDPSRISSSPADLSDVSHLCGVGALDGHEYFKVNETVPGDTLPTFEMLGPPSLVAAPNTIQLRFRVVDGDGLHQVRLHTPEWNPYVAGEFIACQKVHRTNAIVEFVTTELSPKSESVHLWTVDRQGNFGWSQSYPINITNVLPRATTVSIPDRQLAAAVREQIGTITTRSMLNLREVYASGGITELTGLEYAYNLKYAFVDYGEITDVSPLKNLVGLTRLSFADHQIRDINPLANLTNLVNLYLAGNNISDISVMEDLTNLKYMWLSSNNIRNISSLAGLTNLINLSLGGNNISDISAVANLTNLRDLSLGGNNISDISAVANLTNLRDLFLDDNNISDVSAVVNLTNLTYLRIRNNNISDIEALAQIMAQGTVVYYRGNPAFDSPGPVIEDGWVWLIVPATNVRTGSDAARSRRDFLSEASGGTLTEADVARNGAQDGTRVGDSVWTAARLDATDRNNLNTIVSDYNLGTDIRYPVAYGVTSIQSETPQQTRVYIGRGPLKVWLNGTVIYKDTDHRGGAFYETAVPVTLNTGNNLLFIAAYRPSSSWSEWRALFGFEDGTRYTVGAPGAGPGTGVDLDVNADGQVTVIDLAIVALSYGTQVPVGDSLPADVNADGRVDILDLTAVANGIATPDTPNKLSLTEVEKALEAVAALDGAAEAPARFGNPSQQLRPLTYHNVAKAVTDAEHLGHSVHTVLKELLQLLTEMEEVPETTALLPNYPNPFNPETWIPYHLATEAEVILTIYDTRGVAVRTLVLGHQPAGVYESHGRAAYWDGKNQQGEQVASGVYFYTLTAGEFTATRKLLIIK